MAKCFVAEEADLKILKLAHVKVVSGLVTATILAGIDPSNNAPIS